MPTGQTAAPSAVPFALPDLVRALRSHGGTQCEIVARNPKLLKCTFDLLSSIHGNNVIGGISTLTSSVSHVARSSGASQPVQDSAKSAALVMSMFKASMDLAKVAKLSGPGAVGVFVGAATLHKTGLAVSFAGGDSERAKCVGAIMELAGSATVAAVTAPTGILLTLPLASLTASTYNAYLSCQASSPR
jgi:hypothetical protein